VSGGDGRRRLYRFFGQGAVVRQFLGRRLLGGDTNLIAVYVMKFADDGAPIRTNHLLAEMGLDIRYPRFSMVAKKHHYQLRPRPTPSRPRLLDVLRLLLAMVKGLALVLLVAWLAGSADAQTAPTLITPTIKLPEVQGGSRSQDGYFGAVALLSGNQGSRPCTGSNDYPAFAAAINAAAGAGGGTVMIPASTCHTAATIVLPAHVRLVGQGPRSMIVPMANMDSVVQITGGLSSIENLLLQQFGSLASAGVQIAKPSADVLPVDLTQLTVLGFPKAIQAVSGDTIRIHGGFYLNNGIAFSYEPTKATMSNHTIDGGTLVQGGSGINLPINSTAGTGVYPHTEGLLVSDLQVVQGVNSSYCMNISAGVHIKWAGGMCTEVRTGGNGFIINMGVDSIRSVDIGDVFVGVNTGAGGSLNGISVTGGATSVKLHQIHFSGWAGTPIKIAGGSGIAQVDIAMIDFDNTTATNDVTVANATVRIVQGIYDVSTGVSTGPGGSVTSWP
jgi:hypothetical protein